MMVVGDLYLSPNGPRGGYFEVPAGATRLSAVAEWTCATGPLCVLRVVAYGPDEKPAAEAEAASPAHLELEAPEAGQWDLRVFTSMQGSIVADAKGRFHVAVTHPAEADPPVA